MAHTLIGGLTGAGKTVLARATCGSLTRAGWAVLVCDASGQRWPTAYVYPDPYQFLDAAQRSRGCVLIVDEGAASIGRYASELAWLTTESRKYGHQTIILTQRPVQVDRTVRDQCENLCLFLVSSYDAEQLSREWPNAGLERASSLPRFHYLYCTKWSGPAEVRTVEHFLTSPRGEM